MLRKLTHSKHAILKEPVSFSLSTRARHGGFPYLFEKGMFGNTFTQDEMYHHFGVLIDHSTQEKRLNST